MQTQPRTVWVVEWLHPDGTWGMDTYLIRPAFTKEAAERSIENLYGRDAIQVPRRVVPYFPHDYTPVQNPSALDHLPEGSY